MAHRASSSVVEIAAESLDPGGWLLIQLTKPDQDLSSEDDAVARVDELIRAAMRMERDATLERTVRVLQREGGWSLRRRLARWKRGEPQDPLTDGDR